MTKTKLWLLSAFLLVPLALAWAALNFTADNNVTVQNVSFDLGTADLFIYNGSQAESWTYQAGALTVLNPGLFRVGSTDARVKAIQINKDRLVMACALNSNPGTSFVTLPTTAGNYSVLPLSLASCPRIVTSPYAITPTSPFGR